MRQESFAVLQTCVSSAEHLGLALLLGVLAVRPMLSREIDGCLRAEPGLRRCAWVAWALLVAGGIGRLWFVSAAMGHVSLFESRQSIVDLLSLTHYGSAWKWGGLGMAVLGVALLRMPDAWSRLLVALGCAGYAYTLGAVSHAAEEGDFGWVMATAWLHLIATSVWVGLVLTAGIVAVPWDSVARPPDQHAFGAFAARLSTVATGALALVVVTGAIKTWILFDTATAIFSTSSARVLVIKLLLVSLAVALGAVNRLVVIPRIVRPRKPGDAEGLTQALQRFRFIVHVEGVVLVAALATGVLLGTMEPP